MAGTSQWMHRRLAARALKVLNRHKDLEPSIGAYQHTIGVTGLAYVEKYDKLHAYAGARAVTREGGDHKVQTLLRKTRSWAHLLAKTVTGFDRTQYGDTPNVAIDVISDAKNLLGFVEEHEAASQTPLPFSDELKADLEGAIAEADAVSDGVSLADANYVSLRRDVAEAAAAFNADLVAFRGSLRTVLGKGHPDYQKLRLRSVGAADVDDDEVAKGLGDDDGEGIDDGEVVDELEETG